MTENQTRQEIRKKKARVAFLAEFVRDNAPHVARRFADGFFTSAAEDFRSFADHADEIARLNAEIVQLSFDLEGFQSRQTEFPQALIA